MKKPYAYQIQYYASIVLLVLVVLVLIARYYGIFWPDRSFLPGNKTYIEQQRGVPEGSLTVVAGTLAIGPYRALWDQWHTFLWHPKMLSFWLYNFTHEDTKRYFHELGSKGTLIQGIMEREQYASRDNQLAWLIKTFADNSNIVIIPDDRLGVWFQHAKTFLADSWYIIQTANMTYSSFAKNREIYFLSYDDATLASLRHIFMKDRQGREIQRSDIHPNILVCPINCRERIESLLSSAQSSIRMYQQYVADDRIQHILRRKKSDWVTVQLILGKYDTTENDASSPDAAFYTQMSWSVVFQATPYVHAKAILVDEQFLLIGSMNMSDTSMDKNRELGILLLSPQHIDMFTTRFYQDWNVKNK